MLSVVKCQKVASKGSGPPPRWGLKGESRTKTWGGTAPKLQDIYWVDLL